MTPTQLQDWLFEGMHTYRIRRGGKDISDDPKYLQWVGAIALIADRKIPPGETSVVCGELVAEGMPAQFFTELFNEIFVTTGGNTNAPAKQISDVGSTGDAP